MRRFHTVPEGLRIFVAHLTMDGLTQVNMLVCGSVTVAAVQVQHFWGTQGVAVQEGTRLEASNLTFSKVGRAGMDVMDEGSSLKVSKCKVHDLTNSLPHFPQRRWQRGIHVHSSSSAELSDLSVAGSSVFMGIHVSSRACAMIVGSTVSSMRFEGSCMRFDNGGTGRLEACRMLDGFNGHVVSAGSQVQAFRCVLSSQARTRLVVAA